MAPFTFTGVMFRRPNLNHRTMIPYQTPGKLYLSTGCCPRSSLLNGEQHLGSFSLHTTRGSGCLPKKAQQPNRRITQKWGQACKFAKISVLLNFELFQFAKMFRETRLYDPGTLYHVILRGSGGQRIYFDDCDSRRFY